MLLSSCSDLVTSWPPSPLLLLILQFLHYDLIAAYTYYANTGDVMQLHCGLAKSNLCRGFDTDGERPRIVWAYSSSPPDAAEMMTVSSVGRTTTTRSDWQPDFPIQNPQAINSGGRYLIMPVEMSGQPEIILQIMNISWSDAGTYACYCASDFPPRAVGVHQLVIFGRPYVIIQAFEEGYHYALPATRIVSEQNSTTTSLMLAPYSNASMTCVYSNTVFPIKLYVWLRDGHDFASSTQNTFDLIGMTREYRGAYACRVMLSDLVNSTGPYFRLDTPYITTSTFSPNEWRMREEFPILLVVILACVLFVLILLTVVVALVIRTMQKQRQERVRFTLPNSYNERR